MIDKIELENFTLFHKVNVDLCPKINIFIGENGTGKTQLLKAAYAASSTRQQIDASSDDEDIIRAKMTERFIKLFLPLDDKLGKLHRNGADTNAKVSLTFSDDDAIELGFYNNSQAVAVKGRGKLEETLAAPLYIPTKEVLSFMKGFSSLYQRFDLSFDQTYQDICLSLDLPEIRGEALHEKSKWAIGKINEVVGGEFVFYGGGKVTFKSQNNEYSANVMAEGFRKAGMLGRLLQTGAIQPGVSGTLFWDEPESNFNPKLMKMLVELLLELSRQGQQIVLATHDYAFLKWFDLLASEKKGDMVRYHSLYRSESDKKIGLMSTEDYDELKPNPIDEAFGNIINEEISNDMGSLGK
jgi:AAA15 family ATPase/GTPase